MSPVVMENISIGAPLPAFNDPAWGFKVDLDGDATFITGGEGLDPIYVTNQNDGGAGSLRDAIRGGVGGHVCFDSGGIIESTSSTDYKVLPGNMTIHGQTAPGGHCNLHLTNGFIRAESENVIVRHVVSRNDDGAGSPAANNRDGAVTQVAGKILFDHCSMAFTIDELWSMFGDRQPSSILQNVTFFKCMAGFPLHDSVHPEGVHGFGPTILYYNRMAAIGCLFGMASGRPLIRPRGHFAMLNNYTYTWSGSAWQIGQEDVGDTVRGRIQNSVWDAAGSAHGESACIRYFASVPNDARIYRDGNDYGGITPLLNNADPGVDVSTDDGIDQVDGIENMKLASEVWDDLKINCGANPSTRDSVDQAIIAAIDADDTTWIDTPEEIGGHPSIETKTHTQLHGKSMQELCEDNVGISNYHLVAPGFNNLTNLGNYLNQFVSGEPPA